MAAPHYFPGPILPLPDGFTLSKLKAFVEEELRGFPLHQSIMKTLIDLTLKPCSAEGPKFEERFISLSLFTAELRVGPRATKIELNSLRKELEKFQAQGWVEVLEKQGNQKRARCRLSLEVAMKIKNASKIAPPKPTEAPKLAPAVPPSTTSSQYNVIMVSKPAAMLQALAFLKQPEHTEVALDLGKPFLFHSASKVHQIIFYIYAIDVFTVSESCRG